MPVKALSLTIALFLGLAGDASADDPVVGVWQAPPDGKGQIGHIEITHCRDRLCGTIIRAFAPDGREIVTPNVGRRIVWDMRAQGAGRYGDGQVYVPIHKRAYDATMKLSGARLILEGCLGPVCQGQVWVRVK